MRHLEDCKAEVFRRSEERIKERKRTRNRMMACCIPLCLLLVAGGVYIRPLLEPVDDFLSFGEKGAIPEREQNGVRDYVLLDDMVTVDTTIGSVSTDFVSVELTDRTGTSEVFRNITDETTVGAFCDFLTMYFDMPSAKESVSVEGFDTASTTIDVNTAGQGWDTIIDELKSKYDLEEKPADYILVFRRTTGEDFVFRLHGSYLYNEKNGCVVKLDDKQLTELKKQLEQAEGYESDK